jgi:ketosteroid isomerase-like protein
MPDFLRKRLFALYEAYAEGRVHDVLRELDDNIVMTSYAPVGVFPFLGRKAGKAAIAQAMEAVHREYEYIAYQPVFMVCEDDSAAAIILAKLRQRSSGRIVQLFVADFLRMQSGRIIELRQFLDSFDAVQQVLGHEIALG